MTERGKGAKDAEGVSPQQPQVGTTCGNPGDREVAPQRWCPTCILGVATVVLGDPFRVDFVGILPAGRADLRLLKGDAFSVYLPVGISKKKGGSPHAGLPGGKKKWDKDAEGVSPQQPQVGTTCGNPGDRKRKWDKDAEGVSFQQPQVGTTCGNPDDREVAPQRWCPTCIVGVATVVLGDPFRVDFVGILPAGRADLRLLKGDAFSVYLPVVISKKKGGTPYAGLPDGKKKWDKDAEGVSPQQPQVGTTCGNPDDRKKEVGQRR